MANTINSMNVVCNKDLFLYIQQFVNGEEGLVRNFRLEIGNSLSITELLKEALMVTNWKVVERIYQTNQEHINKHILDEWKSGFINVIKAILTGYMLCCQLVSGLMKEWEMIFAIGQFTWILQQLRVI